MSDPTVTIGLFVFNGQETLRPTIDSLLGQSFTDFELVISDNASTDDTESICREYAERDHRIRYVRQAKNMGASANVKFVFDAARGEFFTWAACDDIRSPNFIEVNLSFLLGNVDYVASTSPNGFEGQSLERENLVSFALDEDIFERYVRFFEYCWMSHGIFYSLIRTNVLRDCAVIGQEFFAVDWVINLHLASQGKIHRHTDGYTVFGINGVSRSNDPYKIFRSKLIELPFPFYRLTRYTIELSKVLPVYQRLSIIRILVKLNARTLNYRVRAYLYTKYRAVFKSKPHQNKTGEV